MVVLIIILCGVLIFTPLIIIHEGGHFLAARAFGMRVSEFFVGLPCRVRLSWRGKRGTEFGITPLLLGGYNRILGMDTTEDDKTVEVLACVNEHGRVTQSEIAKQVGIDEDRTRVILASLVDIGSVRPYYDEAKGEKKWQKAWPESFETVARDHEMRTILDKGYIADDEAGTAAGDKVTFPVTKLYNWDMSNTYIGKKRWQRVVVCFAGPLANLLTAFILLIGVVTIVGTLEYDDINVVGSVQKDSFAEAAGLQEGDVLASVEGVACNDWPEFFDELHKYFGKGEGNMVEIGIIRDGEPMTVAVEVPNDQEGKIGVIKTSHRNHMTIPEATVFSFEYMGKVCVAIAQLFTPKAGEIISQSVSVVGVSYMAYEYATEDTLGLLELIIALSVSLGFFNLLPIPPLDGGHILVCGIEAIRRKRLPAKVLTIMTATGMSLMLLLFAIMVFQDIGRIASLG